ncbi:unnamed protein product [Dimorphilus gyrociliatus]|uniref:Uncharacterized protein n=1 Tax=Dimorphilus gyrociliatus TaxID=2664684 RepID=A0A7I8VH54_9ANNE|nr:unnamed protein product [Dimorphilus gyrociliatus]
MQNFFEQRGIGRNSADPFNCKRHSEKPKLSNEKSMSNLKDEISNEIEKIKEKKEMKLAQIEQEVRTLKAVIAKHESILNEEVESFYSNRQSKLESLLESISTIEKPPTSNDAEIQSLYKSTYSALEKKLIKVIENTLSGDIAFTESKLNSQVTIGEITLPIKIHHSH